MPIPAELLPYVLELRATLDAALHRSDQLEALTREWLEIHQAWMTAPHGEGVSLSPWGALQSKMFDEIEGFLAAFARVSLLLFPIADKGFAAERGQKLRALLRVEADSLLNSRDLRDSWMHHDERLDFAMQYARGHAGQKFTLAAEVSDEMRKAFLRILEVDTLVMHFRDREGGHCSASLRGITDALRAVDQRRQELK
jgi:hypothetical protein